MRTKALVGVSAPGNMIPLRDHNLCNLLIKCLKEKGITGTFVDTFLGWGCLDQDWFEFSCEIDTDWGWCRLLPFNDSEWEFWHSLFVSGALIMQIHYEENDKLIPHH